MEIYSKKVEFYSGPFKMAGQIDYPDELNEFPVILIIQGPAAHDRDGNVRGYPAYKNYYKKIGQALLESGYAVFRFDKGGTGNSSSGLNARSDIVAAYRAMNNQPKTIKSRVGILAHGGGAAHVYKKWDELININQPNQLILLSTGVNDLKIMNMDIPIFVIVGEDRGYKSKLALDKYSEKNGVISRVCEINGANEQLCENEKNQANLFKEGGCELAQQVILELKDWLKNIK